ARRAGPGTYRAAHPGLVPQLDRWPAGHGRGPLPRPAPAAADLAGGAPADGQLGPDEATVQARLTCYCRFADDVPAEVVAAAEAAVRAKEEEARAEQEARAARRRSTRTRSTPQRSQ